ncbi:MAG: DUF1636 domain-containing protein [Pseudomonadota bacterium]
MKTTITVCDTCNRAEKRGTDILPKDGEILAHLVEQAALGDDTLEIRRFGCLAGCDHACNISIQEAGKFSYVLGCFEPTQEKADAIVGFAQLYHQSKSGMVPLKERPTALKGHMRAKLPILD